MRAVLARALAMALVLALLLIALRRPAATLAFALIDASAAVEREAAHYVAIRILSAPAALANFVVFGWFLGRGNARAGLVLQVLINGVNIALDVLFVVGLGMAVAGVAWATVIAEYAGLAVGLLMVARALGRLPGRLTLARVIEGRAVRRIVGINRDIFLRSLALILGFAWFTAAGAALGDVVLAANAVLMILVTFVAHGLDGFAFAAEVLIGRAVGVRDAAAFRAAVRAASAAAAATALAFSAVYLVAGGALVDLLTSIPEVRAAAHAALPWAVAMPLVAVWSYQLDGIFLGATRTAEMRNAMAGALAVFALAVLVLRPLLGIHGLWLALGVFFAARAGSLLVYYPRLVRGLSAAR